MKFEKIGKQITFSLMAALLLIPAFASTASADTPLSLKLATNTIQISTFYNGTSLKVSGSIPADTDVVLQISGPKHDVHLKEKGKVAGFLWMNKTDVSLENTPAVYMVYTPQGPKENFLSLKLGIGYTALEEGVTIEPASADKDFIFGEYVKLMEKSGVYAVKENGITYSSPQNGSKDFTATLAIPSKMSAGDYTVKAVAVKDGTIIDQTKELLTLELTGLPAIIASLAYGSPLLFGFMAVFIAIGAGLIIGMIFRGGGEAH